MVSLSWREYRACPERRALAQLLDCDALGEPLPVRGSPVVPAQRVGAGLDGESLGEDAEPLLGDAGVAFEGECLAAEVAQCGVAGLLPIGLLKFD